MANSNTAGFGLIAAGTVGSTPATQWTRQILHRCCV